MRTLDQLQERLKGYVGVEYIYDPDVGCIAWRCGTGENLEALFIERSPHFQGDPNKTCGASAGMVLYAMMVKQVEASGKRPYHSCFAFVLAGNERANKFYRLFGWKQVNVGSGLYGGDDCVLTWIPWKDMLDRLTEAGYPCQTSK